MTAAGRYQFGAWAEAKLGRARTHMAKLDNEIAAWIASSPYRIESVIAADRLGWRLVLRLEKPPPVMEWSTILGDCVHNYRSALDAAIWELAHTEGAVPSNPKLVQFPFIVSKEEWPERSRRMLTGLPPAVVERIRLAQPFMHTREGKVSALALLNTLDIDDKHKAGISAELKPTNASRQGQVRFETDEAAARHRPPTGPVSFELVDGALLHEEPTKDPIVEVRGAFDMTVVVTIETPVGRTSVPQAVELLDRAVTATLDGLYGLGDVTSERTARS